MSRKHGCCHWRSRCALSPNHRQLWIFHFSEFSSSCFILNLLSCCINSSPLFLVALLCTLCDATLGVDFSARAQERLLNVAVTHDARVSGLENLFVQLTLSLCRREVRGAAGPETNGDGAQRHVARSHPVNPEVYPDSCWEVLDSIDLEEAFQHRFSVLQSCPHHVKGRFRQVARHVLEARSHAVRIQDRRGEVRGWKLFCLMPMMFLRRSSSDGEVSKEEMCHRFNLFTSGEWGRLWQETLSTVRAQFPTRDPRKPLTSEQRAVGVPQSAIGRSHQSEAVSCRSSPGTWE